MNRRDPSTARRRRISRQMPLPLVQHRPISPRGITAPPADHTEYRCISEAAWAMVLRELAATWEQLRAIAAEFHQKRGRR